MEIFQQHKMLKVCDSQNVGPLETLGEIHFILSGKSEALGLLD
jgi:hypothetical protein